MRLRRGMLAAPSCAGLRSSSAGGHRAAAGSSCRSRSADHRQRRARQRGVPAGLRRDPACARSGVVMGALTGPPTSGSSPRPGDLGLRVRTFAHVHRLSIADHNESKRGELVARVTSDVVTIAQLPVGRDGVDRELRGGPGTFGVMAIYSWQLTLVSIAFVPAPCHAVPPAPAAGGVRPVRTPWARPWRRSPSRSWARAIRAYGVDGRSVAGAAPSTTSNGPTCARPATSR